MAVLPPVDPGASAAKGVCRGGASLRQVVGLAAGACDGANNYAYLLADKLDQSKRALALARSSSRPGACNAHVLDTLGWAQYHAGQLEAAKETLERSQRLQALPETCLHLAQVQRCFGTASEARSQLERAVQLAQRQDNETVLNEARQQLKQDLPYAVT